MSVFIFAIKKFKWVGFGNLSRLNEFKWVGFRKSLSRWVEMLSFYVKIQLYFYVVCVGFNPKGITLFKY